MGPQEAQGSRSSAERVQEKRRTGLFTLLFTDVVGSTQLKAALGDQSGVALIQSHLSALPGTM
jgi:class 3 adenylate cyclase